MLGSTVAPSVSIRLLSVAQVEVEEVAAAMVVDAVATTLAAEEVTVAEVGIVCSYHLSLLSISANHIRRRWGLWWTRGWRLLWRRSRRWW